MLNITKLLWLKFIIKYPTLGIAFFINFVLLKGQNQSIKHRESCQKPSILKLQSNHSYHYLVDIDDLTHFGLQSGRNKNTHTAISGR